METLDAINTRRSVRKFDQEKQVSNEQIQAIIKAWMQAPSAYNQQPWNFIIIQDKNTLDQISQISEHLFMVKTCSAAIIIYTDTDKHLMPEFWTQDCSACAQNILLATRDLDLWATRCGINGNPEKEDKLNKIIKTPDNILPFCIIPIGYSIKEQIFRDNFDKTKIHHEQR